MRYNNDVLNYPNILIINGGPPMTNQNWHFETQTIHAGQEIDDFSKSRAVPIYQTSSYVFDNTQHAQDLFA